MGRGRLCRRRCWWRWRGCDEVRGDLHVFNAHDRRGPGQLDGRVELDSSHVAGSHGLVDGL